MNVAKITLEKYICPKISPKNHPEKNTGHGHARRVLNYPNPLAASLHRECLVGFTITNDIAI
jgi:hypothetical protein